MIHFVNDFHNTKISIRRKMTETGYLEIGETTYRKIKNTLCGISDCQCGITRGSDREIYKDKGKYFIACTGWRNA